MIVRRILLALLFAIFLWSNLSVNAQEIDLLFDMGPQNSPVASWAIPVYRSSLFAENDEYGWLEAPQTGFNDESGLPPKADASYPLHLAPPGKALYRDGFEDIRPIRFQAKIKPGKYLVTVFLGRYQRPRHDLEVKINGRLVAENVDAWGQVWGSQGGTPVKSVKVPVHTEDGYIRLEVNHQPSKPDSWKEYTNREPEGGRLWYLGQNKTTILGVRIRTMPTWPLRRESNQWIAPDWPKLYQQVLKALNEEELDKAVSLLESIPADDSLLDWVLASDAIVGHPDTPEEKRIELLQDSLSKLRQIRPVSTAVKERIEVQERLLIALQYLRMWSYSWAQEKTGLNGYKRYWAAYELCNPVSPEDPLYPLSLLLRMRVSYWNGREGGWKHCYDLARRHAEELKIWFSDNPLVRMYLGESIGQNYQARPAPADAPRWAVLQREALGRMQKVIHYWVQHRQSENGELGGGWGDDVEILRNWVPLVLAIHDPIARRGAKNIADGVYASGDIENGYSKRIGDVEHAAEPVSDTQPLMMATCFADPQYFERCLQTMHCMRNVWTARDKNDDLHFKSYYYSASQTVDSPPRSADVPLNGRAAKPGIWLMWYSSHPEVKELLTEWSMAWVRAAQKTVRGKPVGIIPGSVSFPEGRIGGYADTWWETKGYDDLDSMGYTSKLYHIMLACWAETGDEQFLQPIFAALQVLRDYRESKNRNPAKGSRLWVGQIHDTRKFFDVIEKWRALSGDDRFDDLLAPRATGQMRYLITGNTDRLEQELQHVIKGLTHNIPMITTEVLFTDRVSIPGSEVLASMLTGSLGNPTYYPLHAVTWDGVGDEVAAFVTKSNSQTLQVQLYNFAEGPRQVTMRFWQLEPGTYQMKLVLDNESEKPYWNERFSLSERGFSRTIKLSDRGLYRLNIVQKQRVAKSNLLPDLAVGPEDAKRVSSGKIKLTVHNLGNRNTGAFRVRLSAGTWKKEISPDGIKAPLDLVPKSVTLFVDIPLERSESLIRIAVDPDNKIDELYEQNNMLLVQEK